MGDSEVCFTATVTLTSPPPEARTGGALKLVSGASAISSLVA